MTIALTVLEDSRPGIGACVLLEYEGKRLLLDCGYDDSQATGRNLSFPVPAESIHAVVLSHGHLGHCGLLPILVRDGFRGKVYCTADSHKVATFSMLEAALLQDEERQYRAAMARQDTIEPVYMESEVTACQPLFVSWDFGKPVSVDEHLAIEFFRAGHCAGSAFVKISVREGDSQRKILYIGDAGAKDNDLCTGPVIDDSYDHLILPAFKVGRQDVGETEGELAAIINRTRQAGGNILIPVSSVDRRDAILQIIQDLSVSERIPSVFVFLDSPIASRQRDVLPLEPRGSDVYPCLQSIDTVADSKGLNPIRGTAVIIAGSGKGGYGRIGFHLKRHAPGPENAIVLLGAQAGRWLDHALNDSGKTLSVLGQEIEVNAQIYRLDDATLHVNVDVITEWLARMKSVPRYAYIVHGSPEAKAEFRNRLQKSGVQNVHVPMAGEEVAL